MKNTIIINFDSTTADLLPALQESIHSVLFQHGCDIDLMEEHSEATLIEVRSSRLDDSPEL